MSAPRSSEVFLGGFDQSARTALGDSWALSWPALLRGTRNFASLQDRLPDWPDDMPVASLKNWPHGVRLGGRARALALAMGRDSRALHAELIEANPSLALTIIVATSHGETYAVSEFAEHLRRPGTPLAPDVAQAVLCDVLLGAYLEGLGASWPGSTVSAACASACVATGMAATRIRMGLCDACLVVSLDVLSRIAHAGFRQIGAMSREGCQPFDRHRDGTTIGEAGTVFLLMGGCVKRPAALRWSMKVSGFGQSCDARHPVEPTADGLERALHSALTEAGCAPADLAGIYWHGTGTLQNDRTEAEVAQRLFAGVAPPGTSTKGAFGHTMGASAALSVLAAGETLRTGALPPVGGLTDIEFPVLNLVQGGYRNLGAGPLAVASLGFGGINAALVLSAA